MCVSKPGHPFRAVVSVSIWLSLWKQTTYPEMAIKTPKGRQTPHISSLCWLAALLLCCRSVAAGWEQAGKVPVCPSRLGRAMAEAGL